MNYANAVHRTSPRLAKIELLHGVLLRHPAALARYSMSDSSVILGGGLFAKGEKLDGCADLEETYRSLLSVQVKNIYREVLTRTERKNFPTGFWNEYQGKVNFSICLRWIMMHLNGPENGVSVESVIKRLSTNEGHNAFLRDEVEGKEKNWFKFFQQERVRLLAPVQSLFNNNACEAFKFSFPEAFDLYTPEGQHLHFWDFESKKGKGAHRLDDARQAFVHTFQNHIFINGKKLVFPRDAVPETRLPELQRFTYLPRRTGTDSWTSFFKKYNLYGVIQWVPELERSHYLHLLEFFPWAFNLDTEEGAHLHEFDFINPEKWEGYEGVELAKKSVRHMLEKHFDLKMSAPRFIGDSYYIDTRLVEGRIRDFLSACGAAEWRRLLTGQLYFLKRAQQINPHVPGNIVNVFKWVYPWAFDLSTPEGSHAHFWQIALEHPWAGIGEIRTIIIHELAADGITMDEIPSKATEKWFIGKRLKSVVNMFKGKAKLFRAIFPEAFESGQFTDGMFNQRNKWRQASVN